MNKFWEDLFFYPILHGPFGPLNYPVFILVYSWLLFIPIAVIIVLISELFSKVVFPAAQRLLCFLLIAPFLLVFFLPLVSLRFLTRRLFQKRRKSPLPPPCPTVTPPTPNPSRPPIDKDLFEHLVETEYYHPKGWLH